MSDPSYLRRRWLLLAIVLVLWGLITHSSYIGSGDEPHYLAATHSLAFDLDLDLSNNYGPAEPLISGGALEAGAHVREGRHGVLRPVHDVGMPLLFAPYARVMAPLVSWAAARIPDDAMRRLRLTPSTLYRHLLSSAMILIATLLALVMFDALACVTGSRRVAFWTALLISLSPPLLIHSVLFFTEVVSAVLCLVAFRVIAIDRGGSRWAWAAAGAATGLLLLVHVRNAGLILGLTGLAAGELWRRRAGHDALAFTSAAGALVLLRTAINVRFWGTVVTTPHARPGEWTGWFDTMATAGLRLGALMLDQEFGLLVYAPVFLIAAAGAFSLARENAPLLLKISAVVAGYLLVVALPITNVHGWAGGWSPVARFMVPIVPLLALCVGAGVRSMPRVPLAAIVAAQIGISAYGWQNPKNLWNDGDGVAALCTRGGLRICSYLPSFVNR